MELFEKTISSEDIYDGRIIKITCDTIELPDGRRALREVVGHPGGACVVPIDEKNNILMVEQFRYPMKEIVLEIPAGKLEWGENPDSAVERELREETGFTADNIEYLGVNYPTPGYCAEKLYLYMATGLHKGEQELDADEYLNVKSVPFSVAVDMVMNNSIKDSKTVAAILLAARRLGL
ncbi:MAG: NUDIX hydrolase [Oscillospiraceae bacterium]